MAVEQGRTDYKVEAVIAKAMADLRAYTSDPGTRSTEVRE